MSVNQVYIVDELKQKIQKLVNRLEDQKATNQNLINDKQDLIDKINEQEKEIQELKQVNNTLKLSKAFTAENGESQEAKLQINKIVREIDKCIALLNR
jgi:septal ring factor EnvC (AmiA/AmiB activator)